MLPEGWAIQTLEDLASVQRGKFSPRPRNDPRYYGGKTPFVQTGDVTSAGKYLIHFSQTLNEDGVGVSKVFPRGTILITIAANIGHTAITTFDVACPDSVVGIQVRPDKCDVQWLKDLLETKREELDGLSTQNAQKNINLEVLKPLTIMAPPLPEQQKIAEILSTWDRAIETVEKLIANARAQKKALMQHLLTGQKRLPGFSGEWQRAQLDKMAVVTMGSSPSSRAYNDRGEGLPLIQGNADISGRLTVPRVYTSEITQTCAVGDIIFSVRAPVGEVAWSEHEACLGRGVAGIRPRSSTDRNFLYYMLLNAEDKWKRLSQGSTFQAVNGKELKGFDFLAPISIKEQQAISSLVYQADGIENGLMGQKERLLKEKSALMQQLLTGKRRVKVGEVAG